MNFLHLSWQIIAGDLFLAMHSDILFQLSGVFFMNRKLMGTLIYELILCN